MSPSAHPQPLPALGAAQGTPQPVLSSPSPLLQHTQAPKTNSNPKSPQCSCSHGSAVSGLPGGDRAQGQGQGWPRTGSGGSGGCRSPPGRAAEGQQGHPSGSRRRGDTGDTQESDTATFHNRRWLGLPPPPPPTLGVCLQCRDVEFVSPAHLQLKHSCLFTGALPQSQDPGPAEELSFPGDILHSLGHVVIDLQGC